MKRESRPRVLRNNESIREKRIVYEIESCDGFVGNKKKSNAS